MSLFLSLLVGIAAGWIAGMVLKGKGFGLFGNLIVGVAGAFLGGFLFSLAGITAGGLVGVLLMSIVGAVVLLFVVRLFF